MVVVVDTAVVDADVALPALDVVVDDADGEGELEQEAKPNVAVPTSPSSTAVRRIRRPSCTGEA